MLAVCAMAVVMMLMTAGGVSAVDEFPTTNESTDDTTTSHGAQSSSSYFVSPGTISDNGLPWPMNQVSGSSMLVPNAMSAVFFAIGSFIVVALF